LQTPAHDPNDYECGKRNNLEFITMLTPDGSINENGAPFTGMMRYDARIAVEAALQEKVSHPPTFTPTFSKFNS
jgi:valyl-tRNA synthetase